MFKFKTNISMNDVSMYGVGRYIKKILSKKENSKFDDYIIEDSNINVDWTFDLEVRGWGIKSMQCNIDSISGSIEIKVLDKFSKPLRCVEYIFDSNEIEKWTIVSKMSEKFGTGLQPTEVAFDFDDNTITVF